MLPVVLVTVLLASDRASAKTCSSLSSLTLPAATITAAEPRTTGSFPHVTGADLPGFCRVTATLTPTSESDIRIEVWLPLAGWNRKLDVVGNGGWSGSIPYAALAAALRRGYAAAGTDTGHEGGGGPWMQNREKLIDFGYRAVHETTIAAKAIAAAFYDAAPRFSYFTGCSGAGRQALMAAQRYPGDFNGIVAGAPSLNATGRAAFAMWTAQQLRKEAASFIPPANYPAIHDAVLEACDGQDGVRDGVVENPSRCAFDPRVLACGGEASRACLTAPQIRAARAIYEPLVDASTGEAIAPGLSYGSELGWATFGGAQPFALGTEMFRYLVFDDPDWDYRSLNVGSDMTRMRRAEAGVINAMDPDLSAFFARGGKLIHYHGWADPQIQPLSSVEYYERVVRRMGGASNVRGNYRLFMVPGMAHCGSGNGTSTFDMVSALERWAEHDEAPASIPASRVIDGRVDRTRPLCPYPQQAAYRGSGDINDARNFVCR